MQQIKKSTNRRQEYLTAENKSKSKDGNKRKCTSEKRKLRKMKNRKTVCVVVCIKSTLNKQEDLKKKQSTGQKVKSK